MVILLYYATSVGIGIATAFELDGHSVSDLKGFTSVFTS